MKISAMVLTILAAAATSGFAEKLDWTQDMLPQFQALPKEAVAAPAAVPAQTVGSPESTAPFEYYEGTIKLATGEKRSVCLNLSTKQVDEHSNDSETAMRGVFVTQDVPSLEEKGPSYDKTCSTALEWNGSFLKTCSGLVLEGAKSMTSGNVTKSHPGATVGTYSLKPRASACPITDARGAALPHMPAGTIAVEDPAKTAEYAYYKGTIGSAWKYFQGEMTLTATGESRSICFAFSPTLKGKSDDYEYEYHDIVLRENQANGCAGELSSGGDIATCGGLLLSKIVNQGTGEISSYSGSLTKTWHGASVGSWSVNPVASCPL